MQLNPPSTGFASAAVFLTASLWGIYWVPLRYLEGQGISGVWSIVLLNAPAVIALSLIVFQRWDHHRGHFGQAVAVGLFTGLGLALYASGLVYSSVVRATLLFYLTPVWATLIGMYWLGEKACWQRWTAIGGGLTGLFLLVSGDGSVPLNIGDLYAFLSGVFWAIGAALIMRYDKTPLPGMTMFQFFFTTIGAIALGMIAGDFGLLPYDKIASVLPLTSMLSVVAFLPAVYIIFWAQKYLFPGRVGLLMMSEVIVAVITASLFIPEERLSGLEWFGAVMIIGACLLEVLFTPKPQPEPA